MKKVIFIVLCFALYAPNIVQLINYSKCTIEATNVIEQQICDCIYQKNIISTSIPLEHKDHQFINEDWKYIVPSPFIANNISSNCSLIKFNNYLLNLPSKLNQKIFHPPIS